jgi:hypothetical protein
MKSRLILLGLLDVSQAVVTNDGISCQTEIAAAIETQGSDYVLAVKGHQKRLPTMYKLLLSQARASFNLSTPEPSIKGMVVSKSASVGRPMLQMC